MYFSKTTALTLSAFFQVLFVSGAPLVVPRAAQSLSFSSLQKPILSPYYLYFGNPSTPKLADAITSLNMKTATVAFASAPKGQCSLTADLDNLVSDVQAFIGKGGVVSLSFGGNLQGQSDPRQHVQQACPDAPSLTQLIKDAMTKFNTHNIEFDIEDNTLLSDTAASARLAQALVQVKKDISDTFITYTVGANPSGMPDEQNAYVQAAKDNGLTIDALTLMTMNMGGSDNVKDSQTAITGAAAQLEKIYGLRSGEGIKKMGMLPAIGVDNNGKFIDLNGITTLAQFATQQGMTLFSYWSFNRDFPGDAGSSTQSLSDSSSPDQKSPSQFYSTVLSTLTSAGSLSSGVVPSPEKAQAAAGTDTLGGQVGVVHSNGTISSSVVVPSPEGAQATAGAQAVVVHSNVQPDQKSSLPPASSP